MAHFDLTVNPGEGVRVTVTTRVERESASALDADRGSDAISWPSARVEADDPRLGRAFAAAADDLRHLLLRDPDAPDDVFAAAGTPWYLTLFGRDSLWAARMMLPFGTELAAGTLRTLARRQGRRTDETTAEAPGKIPHELRRTAYVDPESGLALPPVYYGTVDATALWVTLLGEAWQWGLPLDDVRALLPNLRSAVSWLTGPGQPDADGLLKYLDTSGSGLANQGWKDSGDSIRWRDGRVADAPIALVEAQAYAVEALAHAAHLLRALGEPGAEEAEHAAGELRLRIAGSFWVETDAGRHLAIALDGHGAAVDGLGSNMGHVLGTGALSPAEASAVAATVTGEEMLDTFGVRTLGSRNGGFNPIGYHTGSIWTHDTAIVALGLMREGHREEAATVARALLDSAEAFDYRWPELYSGRADDGTPLALPGLLPAAGVVGCLRGRAGGGGPGAAARWAGRAPGRAAASCPLRRRPGRGAALPRARLLGGGRPGRRCPGHRDCRTSSRCPWGALRLGRIFRKGLSPSWVCSRPSTAPPTSSGCRPPR